MTESTAFNALKHGAFSEVLILPGEDPAAFEKLKQRLFAEYNVSGCFRRIDDDIDCQDDVAIATVARL